MQQRKWRRSILCLFFFAVVFMTLTGGMACAEYPEKPITLIVPWPPGGASDITPRSLVKIMSEELKQPVVVVNRPGAAAVVGTLEMERAVPDGTDGTGASDYKHKIQNRGQNRPPEYRRGNARRREGFGQNSPDSRQAQGASRRRGFCLKGCRGAYLTDDCRQGLQLQDR